MAYEFFEMIPSLSPHSISKIVETFNNSTSLAPLDPFLYQALHADLEQANKPHITQEWTFQATFGLACGAILLVGVVVAIICAAGVYKRRRALATIAAEQARNQELRNDFVDRLRDPLMNQPPMPDAIPPPR